MTECPFCEKNFPTMGLLAAHLRKRHKATRDGDPGAIVGNVFEVFNYETSKWDRWFHCWCGDFPFRRGRGKINKQFASHLRKVGGPAACILKATLGIKT